MAKLTLTDISSGYLSTSTYNANNTLIETALENTLSRDGTSPNTMSANLDMNSNKIVNLTDPTNNQDAATKAYVDGVSGGIDTLAELTDVTSAATTSGYMLIADGSAYVGRALGEAEVEAALASATAFTVNNYVFNVDQTVGAGQDNYVLTYDHGTGEIGLEAAAGGGGLANVVEDTTPQLGGNLDTNSFNMTGTLAATIWTLPTNNYLRLTGDGTGYLHCDLGTDMYLGSNDGSTDVIFNHNNSDCRESVTGTRFNAIPRYWSGFSHFKFDNPAMIKESAAAVADEAGYGQCWVKNDTPNRPRFTDDAGTDFSVALLEDANTFTGAQVMSTSLNAVPLARSVSATGNTAATDYGIIINLTGGTGQTFTLDADPPTNAVVMFDNSAGASWTIAASVSLIWAKDGTTGNRTLADDGIAVAKHRGSGTWIINGSAKLT